LAETEFLHHEDPGRAARKDTINWTVCVIICRPDHDQQHCYHHAPTVKPEAATAVELPMMGVRTPETCWAVHKRQVINLRNCCIYLVDLFEMYDDARTCKL